LAAGPYSFQHQEEIKVKLRSLIATGFAGASLALACVTAQANVLYGGPYTFLGSFTVPPGTPNSESFGRGQSEGFPVAVFDDYWIFNLSPAGIANMSVNFVPIGAITGLVGGIYNASGWTCGATCAGGSIGSMIVSSGPPTIAFPGVAANLAAGQYAVRVQGTNTSSQTSYTGQVSFSKIPEPGTLALLGLGLAGLAFVRRRQS
jgi:hypothetical protein